MKVDIGAAFSEGFRIIGREPLTVAGWALAAVASYIVLAVVVGVFGGAFSVATMFNPERIREGHIDGGVIASVIVFYVVLAVLELLFFAVLGAAIYRSVLEPGGSRAWARLRIGVAEWLFALALFLLSLIFIPWAFVTLVVIGAFANAGDVGGVAALVVLSMSALGYLSLFAFVGPMTIDRRRFVFGKAVAAAAREFWRLAGLNLLLGFLLVAIYVLMIVLAFAFLGGALRSISSADPRQVGEILRAMLLSPVTWFLFLFVAPLVGVALQAMFIAPAAKAYADSQGAASSQIDVFN